MKKPASGHFSIEGEMSIYRAAEIKDALMQQLTENQALEIDLSRVSEIDAAGLQLMVLAKQEATALGKSLKFHGHSQAVLELFDLADLAGIFGDPVVISA